jgi:hypothetical protein
MSDNLGHRINDEGLSGPNPAIEDGGDFSNYNPDPKRSQELTIKRGKEQKQKDHTIKRLQRSGRIMGQIGRAGQGLGETIRPSIKRPGQGLNVGGKAMEKGGKSLSKEIQPGQKTMAQKIAQAQNIAQKRVERAKKKAASGDVKGSAKELAKLGGQQSSRWWLTSLWGSVWADYTFLSLLGLNFFLIKTVFLPNNKYICNLGEDYMIGKWMPKELALVIEIMLIMIVNIFIAAIIMILIYVIYKLTSCGTWNYINSLIAGAIPGGDDSVSSLVKDCLQQK